MIETLERLMTFVIDGTIISVFLLAISVILMVLSLIELIRRKNNDR